MSISAMKQALKALEQTTLEDRLVQIGPLDWEYQGTLAVNALRQAIQQAEKTVPSDYSNSHQREWVSLTDEEFEQILKDFSDDPRLMAVEIEVRLMEKNT